MVHQCGPQRDGRNLWGPICTVLYCMKVHFAELCHQGGTVHERLGHTHVPIQKK